MPKIEKKKKKKKKQKKKTSFSQQHFGLCSVMNETHEDDSQHEEEWTKAICQNESECRPD